MTNPYTFNRDTGKYALTTGHLTPEQLEFENTWAVNKAELPGELYSLQTPEQLAEARLANMLIELAFYRRAKFGFAEAVAIEAARWVPGPTDDDVLQFAKYCGQEVHSLVSEQLSRTENGILSVDTSVPTEPKAPPIEDYASNDPNWQLDWMLEHGAKFREDFLKEVGLRVEGTFP